MEDYEDMDSIKFAKLPAPRRNGHRWLWIVGLALAFTLTLGIGSLLGSAISATRAASSATGGVNNAQTFADSNSDQTFAVGPGAQGQCDALTVSSVNGNTIVAKTASGSSVTIHTTGSTQYTQADTTVTASAIKVGVRIHVSGTHNSDGSITATRIDIG